MDGIDADEAGAAFGCRGAPGADGAGPGLGLAVVDPALLVEGLGPQVIEVGHRDGGQARITGLAEEVTGSLQQHPGGGAGQRAVQAVELGQQHDVRGGELTGIGGRGGPVAPRQAPAAQVLSWRFCNDHRAKRLKCNRSGVSSASMPQPANFMVSESSSSRR